jgi:hypothetical protein
MDLRSELSHLKFLIRANGRPRRRTDDLPRLKEPPDQFHDPWNQEEIGQNLTVEIFYSKTSNVIGFDDDWAGCW